MGRRIIITIEDDDLPEDTFPLTQPQVRKCFAEPGKPCYCDGNCDKMMRIF